MIAVCNSQGAFLYNCSAKEADERLINTIKKENEGLLSFAPADDKSCLNYDSNGNLRTTDGMCGWLFNTADLLEHLIKMNCEAVYVRSGIGAYRKYNDLEMLKEAYELAFSKK